MNSRNNYIRLPMKNAYNVRELGGYACQNGRVTKWKSFLRADDLSHLDNDEIEFLIDYGVEFVIDLRSQEECQLQPNPFKEHEIVGYVNIPLMSNVITETSSALDKNPQDFISDFYIDLIKSAVIPIQNVFNEMAKHRRKCILFHCAAGKDRTGIIAMLLLGLAGVDISDIVSNYEITYTYIKQNPVFANTSFQYPLDVLMSKHEYIEGVIEYIMKQYGGISSYLKHINLSDENIQIITDMICD